MKPRELLIPSHHHHQKEIKTEVVWVGIKNDEHDKKGVFHLKTTQVRMMNLSIKTLQRSILLKKTNTRFWINK